MTFWQSQSGAPIDGTAEHSHVSTFKIIPANTVAPVSIKGVELKSYNGEEFYQATYKIIDGDFKGYEVRHKIKCFDSDLKKRDREVNMLLRLFTVCEKKPPHDKAPEGDDFLPLKGCMLGIKIQEWFMDGKEGNWVSEIHPLSAEFKPVTGKKAAHIESALTRNAERSAQNLDTDVPF